MFNFYEYGECYVIDDGVEMDFDLGYYECFLNMFIFQANNVIIGWIYQMVIEKEWVGDYLGKIVQVIFYIIDEIKWWV